MGSSTSVSNFAFDSRRERVLADFLNTVFYPEVATEWEYTADRARQKAGEDLVATFDWLSESKTVDEKAQSSDLWINSPAPTFAMEIYSETWFENGEPTGSIGWFVNSDNETEYYVMVWLPDVSLFKLSRNGEYLKYQPAGIIDKVFSAREKRSEFDLIDENPSVYRINAEELRATNFEQFPEASPDIFTERFDDVNPGEWYYSKQNIYEAKIAVVEKQKVKKALADDGLDRETLLDKGTEAITENSVSVNSSKVRRIMRSGDDDNSGSGDGENPVIAVVDYDAYHEIADRTYHYKQGSWDKDVRLFN